MARGHFPGFRAWWRRFRRSAAPSATRTRSRVSSKPSAPWLPFHCRGGKNRRAPGDPRTVAAPVRQKQQAAAALNSKRVGQIVIICGEAGRNYVLLAISEEILDEMRDCETSKDDLGISLLVAVSLLQLALSAHFMSGEGPLALYGARPAATKPFGRWRGRGYRWRRRSSSANSTTPKPAVTRESSSRRMVKSGAE